MQHSDDDTTRPEGRARTLDDLLVRVGETATPAAPAPGAAPEPRRPPPLTDGVEAVEIAEGPLLDQDVLVEEIAGPIAEQPKADPMEEQRARLRAAEDSLV